MPPGTVTVGGSIYDIIENFVSAPSLANVDPEIWAAVLQENQRQEDHIELIASENYTSPAVMAAQGSQLTNKYAEGYPGKRYYGGCEVVDQVEKLAQERLLRLFGAEHANVQPHSGAQANMAVYFALMEPGDTLLGMNLSEGGHLTHGSPVNFSGRLYNVVAYGVRPDDHRIDYAALRDQAMQVRPRVIVAGASAYPRQIDFEVFGEIAKESGARLVVDMAHIAGLVAARTLRAAGRDLPLDLPLLGDIGVDGQHRLRRPRPSAWPWRRSPCSSPCCSARAAPNPTRTVVAVCWWVATQPSAEARCWPFSGRTVRANPP